MRVAHFIDMCRTHGIKVTPQRIEVFREVICTHDHPDVETIFLSLRRRMPTISMDTVYRTLCVLEDIGVIAKLSPFHGAARYEDNTDPHHHFVCTECGLVCDFTNEEMTAIALPEKVKKWGEITCVRAEVIGICAACRAHKKGK